tara:strand:- start:265 stop:471 length:207 start_codon:yes stop_codon:yes gene_type:complete
MPINDYDNRTKLIKDIISGMELEDIIEYVRNNMQDYYEVRGAEFQEEWERRFGIDDNPSNKERGFSDD